VTLFVNLVDGRQSIASRERQPLRKAEFTGEPGVLKPPSGSMEEESAK